MKTTDLNLRLKKMAVILNGLLAGLLGLTVAALISGCASGQSRRATATPRSGVVCPECRTVLLSPFPTSAAWRGGPPAMVRRHECRGCKGVVTLSDGPDGYRHECSVCKQSPFSCTVNSQ